MGSKEGEPIDYTNLMTPGQIEVMENLGSLMGQNLGRPATPYPGQLSAPPDISQLAAMNTMMGIGGYGGYTAPQFPGYGYSVQSAGLPYRKQKKPVSPKPITYPEKDVNLPNWPPTPVFNEPPPSLPIERRLSMITRNPWKYR